jgi:hypothetical protein
MAAAATWDGSGTQEELMYRDECILVVSGVHASVPHPQPQQQTFFFVHFDFFSSRLQLLTESISRAYSSAAAFDHSTLS